MDVTFCTNNSIQFYTILYTMLRFFDISLANKIIYTEISNYNITDSNSISSLF